jgi:hypothetical protein
MTRLTVALRNFLVQTPEMQNLVSAGTIGHGVHWPDGWVFADMSYASIEKYSAKAMIVLTESGNYNPMNVYNTMQFPRVLLDIWASPTRDANGSPIKDDADNIAENIFSQIKHYVHITHPAVHSTSPAFMGSPGSMLQWGTAAEMASNTGVFIGDCTYTNGPVYSKVTDGNGVLMARYTLGVQVVG